MGGTGPRAARGAAPHGRARLPRHPLPGRVRRLRDGHARLGRARRGARPLHLLRAPPSRCWCTPTWPRCTWRMRGSPAQKARWMPEIIAGRAITAVAVTEPDAGSDVKGIRTTARRDGEHYVLNGAKMFITNGVHADLYFVAAKTIAAGAPLAADLDVHGREGHAGLSRQPRARQARLALVRHRRARLRGLPRAGGKPARPGGSRLLRHHEQFPERAHRDRRHGDGRGAGRARSDARLRDDAKGVRRDAVREAGASGSASRCSRPRSRPGGSSSITRPSSTPRASTARAKSRW